MFVVIVLLALGHLFEWKIDYTLRSVFIMSNTLSSSNNPFLEDGRREKRPPVTDQKLRDTSLQRKFNIDQVNYRLVFSGNTHKKLFNDICGYFIISLNCVVKLCHLGGHKI